MKNAFLGLVVLILASQSFGFTFDKNVPDKLKALITSDFAYIYSIKGNQTSSLHRQIYGQVDGADYKKFFESRISSIGISDCGSATGIACIFTVQPHKFMINTKYSPGVEPLMERIAMYFNVARHAEPENGFWVNSTCPTPFLDADGKDIHSRINGNSMAGESACDISPLGAYGSVAILLGNLAKNCSNCSLQDKKDAARLAPLYLQRVIDAKSHQLIESDSF